MKNDMNLLITTLSLVFYGSDGALGPPIDGGRKCIGADIAVPERPSWRRLINGGSIPFDEALVGLGRPELVVGKVGELVDAEPELAAVPGGVERLDEDDVVPERLEPPRLLGAILVDTAVLRHPLLVPLHHGRVAELPS